MSSPASCFIGYGYIIDLYEECPYENEKTRCLWADNLENECDDYLYTLTSYEPSYKFFGINLSNWVDPGEWEDINNFTKPDNWDECEKLFHKFCPNSNQEPHLKLVCIYWG